MKIVINPDEDLVREIRSELIKSQGYCPCKIEQTQDTKCMCKDFREQVEGECHCGLYIKILENSEKSIDK